MTLAGHGPLPAIAIAATTTRSLVDEATDGVPRQSEPHLLGPQFMAADADGVEDASGTPPVRIVGARKFKDNCLQILREINETGEPVVVTRHKVPMAQISAPRSKAPGSLFGRCADELKILGDMTGAVFAPEEFDMESRPERVLDLEGYDRSSFG